MDREGQESNSSVVFTSDNIGTKATPEYFQNVKGGKKDKTKVENKRTRFTRKTLTIILATVAAILLIVVLIFVIINIVNNSKHGARTGEDLPTTVSEMQIRAYKEAYKEDGKIDYSNSIYYMNDLIADLVETGSDKDLIFAARAFRAILAYQAGGKDTGLQEALSLLDTASTEREKYTIYGTLSRIYIMNEDWEQVNKYQEMMDQLDVEENREATGSGFGSSDEAELFDLKGDADE